MSSPGHADLVARLARALDDGTVRPADLERLLSPPRPAAPRASAVLVALGALVAFVGLGIAYATVFDDLGTPAQVATPYLFPSAALAVCIVLARAEGAGWRSDVAGIAGFAALAVAVGVSFGATDAIDSGRAAAGAVAVAALASAGVVAAVHRATGSRRLLWVGMPAALAVLGVALAYLVGGWEDGPDSSARVAVVILVEAGIAAMVAVALAPRDPPAALAATLWAVVGGYGAVLWSGSDLTDFGVWHLLLAAVVVGAFVCAAVLDSDALLWLGAAGAALWIVTMAVIVGSQTGGALAVVLGGAAIAGLGLLVARVRRTAERRPVSR